MIKTRFYSDAKYNLANEMIRRIAESQTIQIFVLESDFEDTAIANGEICGKF